MQLADYAFQIDSAWQGISWPLSGIHPLVQSQHGKLAAEGQLQDYRLKLNLALSGPDIPPGEWTLAGKGNLDSLAISALDAALLQGGLSGKGQVAWVPEVAWKALIKGKTINPGTQYPQWPGKLDFALSSKGSIKPDGIHLQTGLDALSGKLHGTPIKGQGQVAWSPGALNIDQLALRSGEAHLEAHGSLAKQWDLTWSLKVPKLAAVLPASSGHIVGQGSFSGSHESPFIKADLSAKKVSYQGTKIKLFNAKIQLDPSDHENSLVRIKGQNLQAGGQKIDNIDLKLDGHLAEHKITAHLQHPDVNLRLAAHGGYKKAQWQGQLKQLDLSKTALGNWKLSEPVRIEAAPDVARITELCLKREAASLCTDGKWKAAQGKLDLELKQVQLAWLKDLLPTEVRISDANLSAKAAISLTPRPQGELSLELSPGKLALQAGARHKVQLHFQGGVFKASLDKTQAQANLELHMGDNGISAQARIPRPALDANPTTAPLSGTIKAQVKQLGLLSALIPQIKETEGDIEVDLKLSGQLGEPQVQGDLSLTHGHLAIPAAGIALSELNIKAHGDHQRIDIEGALNSGGKAMLTGYLLLDPEKHWPAEFSVKGDRLEALKLPFVHVLASPDLKLVNAGSTLKVRGKISIPYARITPKQLPSSTRSTSSDLVVIDKKHQPADETATAMDIKVGVELGDEVKFSGFDFKARLSGHIDLIEKPQQPLVGNGEFHILDGIYRTHSTTLTVDHGRIDFAHSPLSDPALDIRTLRQIDDVQVGIDILGKASHPKLKLFSIPSMPQKEILSYLATGEPLGTGEFSARGAASSLGFLGANMLAGQLGEQIGIDEIAFDDNDSDDIKDTKVHIGKHFTENLTIGADVGLNPEDSNLTARYHYGRHWEIDGSAGAKGSAFDVKYTIDIK